MLSAAQSPEESDGAEERRDSGALRAEAASPTQTQVAASSAPGSGGALLALCSGNGKSTAELLAQNVPMAASIAVFLYEGIAYNVIYLGRVLPSLGKSHFVGVYFVAFNLVWGLALWSYVQAHTADPGRVPDGWHEFVKASGPMLAVVPARLEWQPGKATLCRKCQTARPERAHHCHICQVCVLRMDHHCPWIRNCVGFNNHKFFILLVVYAAAAAAVGFLTSLPDLFLCARNLMSRKGIPSSLQLSDLIAFFVFGILAMFFFALLAPMLVTHLPFAFRNMTSIESHYDGASDVNPFENDDVMDNLAEVFGDPGLDWLLPVQPSRPRGDGVSYSRVGRGSLSARLRPAYGGELSRDSEDPEEDGQREAWGEELWRWRYNVRAREVTKAPPEEASPLAQLATWLKTGGSLTCSRPHP